MPVHRRRFRIEEALAGDMPMPSADDGNVGPMHGEIMSELRAIRAQMAGIRHGAGTETTGASIMRESAETGALIETYRAQIEQCEKLKVELDLIHDAISRTKREIAVLHGNSFNREEMARVNGELGAVVGGTEEATQQILEAAESIDQAATALTKVNSPDQQKLLSEEIHRKPHHDHDGYLGWGGRDQGARTADRRSSRRGRPAAERTEAGERCWPRLARRHRRV